jgi:hypothetical protein
MVTDYVTPITTTSERLLFAIETKNEKAVAAALDKLMKNDPTVRRTVIKGRVIWEYIAEEEVKSPEISLSVPSLIPGKEEKKDDESEQAGHFLPHGAVTVAHGELMMASNLDFLLKVLDPIEKGKALADDKAFEQVWKLSETKLGLPKQCLRTFSWTAEEFRPTYELIQKDKMPQSETLLGRTLNTFLTGGKKGVPRQQKIQGKNLPPYDKVSPSLGPATMAGMAEDDGWFIKGVSLKK